MPQCVFSIKVFDLEGKVLASKLHFHQGNAPAYQVDLTIDKNSYKQREKAYLEVMVRDNEGKPIDVNLSVLVINKKELGKIQRSRPQLTSYYQFGADLETDIEAPGSYIDEKGRPDVRKINDLLLALGPEAYKYHDFEPPGAFQPEYKLTVAGRVSSGLNKKKFKQGIGLTLMTFGESSDFQTQVTDSLGRFIFDVNDQFGQEMKVVIQTANKRGNNKNYQVKLDPKASPPVDFDLKKLVEPVDTIVSLLAEKHQQRKLIDDAYGASDDYIDLGEFVVEEYAMTPQREKVKEEQGLPDVVIEGDNIREAEQKWSFGLYSVIQNAFPNDVRIRRPSAFGEATMQAEGFHWN